MRLPILNELRTSREMLDAFGGYNHTEGCREYELYEDRNTSARDFPYLSSRKLRGMIYRSGAETNHIACLFEKDGYLNFILNGSPYSYNPTTGNVVSQSFSIIANYDTDAVIMGNTALFFPDKKFYRGITEGEYGNIEESYSEEGDFTVTYGNGSTMTTPVWRIAMCDSTGAELPITTPFQNTAPSSDNTFWYDTSSKQLYKYSVTEGWVPEESYLQIRQLVQSGNYHLSAKFSKGEAVNVTLPTVISGNTTIGYNKDKLTVISDIGTGNLVLGTQSVITYEYISIPGALTATTSNGAIVETGGKVTIKTSLPDMDFVAESRNRLFGCKYGTQSATGKFVNEIYISKLGDYRHFFDYTNSADAAETITVGEGGAFTGVCAYGDTVVFFKEHCMIRVVGDYPPYSTNVIKCQGVAPGSHRSCCVVGGVLYWHASDGVYAYDGSMPSKVSGSFGFEKYTSGVAGMYYDKYYLSAKDSTGKYHMFVLDTSKGLWHKEDGLPITHFLTHGGELYFIDTTGPDSIRTVGGTGTREDSISWEFVTGRMGLEMPDKKNLSSLSIRVRGGAGQRLFVWVEYDSSGEFVLIHTIMANGNDALSFPISFRRCDHVRLKLQGEGEWTVYGITKTITREA